ncbi:HET-domain-containing protein [Glonium stellatum]|uniref:HET-domain-containing protein n=1 Tax=Glonium stellatum TaxID=574774 RepID=A0A8E2FAI6_9PEZI|nr:HET-domain-containing protein [Glonium stellatum]
MEANTQGIDLVGQEEEETKKQPSRPLGDFKLFGPEGLEEVGEQPPRPTPGFGQFECLPISGHTTFDVNASVKPHLLCHKCQSIREWSAREVQYPRRTTPRRFFRSTYSPNDSSDTADFELYYTGEDLAASRLKGCHLCSLMLATAAQKDCNEITEKSSTGHIKNLHQFKTIRVKLNIVNANLIMIDVGDKGLLSIGPNSMPRTYSNTSTEEAASLSISTKSTATWNLAKEWIEKCKSHKLCNERASSDFMPKRLLDVGPFNLEHGVENQYVRLILPGGIGLKAPYLTLSYCWGATNKIKLTESNHERFASGILIHDLPKTIRDAIAITRRLGFKYIWIDALCILQDSPSDWTEEAASMADVYGSCFLTIAALGAWGSDVGCFGQRDPLIYSPCWLFKTAIGQDFSVYSVRYSDIISECITNSALNVRGWVMQERLLSPRTLAFGVSVGWECLGMESHGLSDESRTSLKYMDTPTKRRFNASGLQNMRDTSEVLRPGTRESLEAMAVWQDILKYYTRSSVTVQSDRVFAISGIIKAFERRTGWKNIVGLWRPFVLGELLWEMEEYARATLFGSPTWSWIGHNGAIYPYPYSDYPKNQVQFARVEGIELPEDSFRLGDGKDLKWGGALRLSCTVAKVHSLPLREVGWCCITPEDCIFHHKKDFMANSGSFVLRTDRLSPKPGPYSFIPLLGYTCPLNFRTKDISGLLVVASNDVPGAYERVGVLKYGVGKGVRYKPGPRTSVTLI